MATYDITTAGSRVPDSMPIPNLGYRTRMTEAAFFDLDKTIIAGSSSLAFGKPLYRAGFLGKGHLLRLGIGQFAYMLFGADEDTLERARDGMLDLVSGWHKAEIDAIVAQTLDEVIEPLVFTTTLPPWPDAPPPPGSGLKKPPLPPLPPPPPRLWAEIPCEPKPCVVMPQLPSTVTVPPTPPQAPGFPFPKASEEPPFPPSPPSLRA